MTDTFISRTSDPVVTPYLRDWHARRFPNSKWPEIERRLVVPELLVTAAQDPEPPPEEEPESEPIIDWNLIRPDKAMAVHRRVHLAEIIKLCARAEGIKVADLVGPRRFRSFSVPRQAAAYLATIHCKHMSLPAIGRKLGGRDHSTIVHARDRVKADLLAGGKRFGPIISYVETHLGLR